MLDSTTNASPSRKRGNFLIGHSDSRSAHPAAREWRFVLEWSDRRFPAICSKWVSAKCQRYAESLRNLAANRGAVLEIVPFSHRSIFHIATYMAVANVAFGSDSGPLDQLCADRYDATPRLILLVVLLVVVAACSSQRNIMDSTKLNDFGARYTAAWCSQNAASVASFSRRKGRSRLTTGPPPSDGPRSLTPRRAS